MCVTRISQWQYATCHTHSNRTFAPCCDNEAQLPLSWRCRAVRWAYKHCKDAHLNQASCTPSPCSKIWRNCSRTRTRQDICTRRVLATKAIRQHALVTYTNTEYEDIPWAVFASVPFQKYLCLESHLLPAFSCPCQTNWSPVLAQVIPTVRTQQLLVRALPFTACSIFDAGVWCTTTVVSSVSRVLKHDEHMYTTQQQPPRINLLALPHGWERPLDSYTLSLTYKQ